MNGWIATPGFALLAMTNAGFFSSLLAAAAGSPLRQRTHFPSR
jgi:hypothetical protein